ncbi:MAG: EamA family transporter [Candidatus Omnitrophica bacterium]|nr:EamA family transporter [Candidatus Omnitrophota bacterium]
MEKITKINQLPVKIFLLIIANDLLDTLAQLLMKKGLGLCDLSSVASYFQHLFNFSNPHIFLFWIGLGIYLSNFFLWMKVLSNTDLSVALPLASSSYILIPFAAVFFLHEFVKPIRWLGLVLIVFGIYFISKSKPSDLLTPSPDLPCQGEGINIGDTHE